MLQPIVDASVSPEGAVSRRGFLRRLAAGVGAAGVTQLGWRDMVIARADELRRAGKSMILLWMDGGPSQYDTFNPKIGSEFQGPATAINTTIPGIQFAEYWPQTAASLDRIALVRSMVSKEKEHDRAIALVRTGYPPSESLRYPAFGSIVARARDDSQFDLPAFVRVGRPRITTRDVDAGVLGVQYNPFKIDEPGKLPPNLVPTVSPDVLRRRLSLGEKFDGEFARSGAPLSVGAEESRSTIARRGSCSVRGSRRSILRMNPTSCAMLTAAARSARAACWPVGWWSKA